jgi:hypothetical protein
VRLGPEPRGLYDSYGSRKFQRACLINYVLPNSGRKIYPSEYLITQNPTEYVMIRGTPVK